MDPDVVRPGHLAQAQAELLRVGGELRIDIAVVYFEDGPQTVGFFSRDTREPLGAGDIGQGAKVIFANADPTQNLPAGGVELARNEAAPAAVFLDEASAQLRIMPVRRWFGWLDDKVQINNWKAHQIAKVQLDLPLERPAPAAAAGAAAAVGGAVADAPAGGGHAAGAAIAV